MKIKKLIVEISVAFLGALHIHAQGFQNLNFEESNPTPDTPGLVAEASALPGWTVEYAGVPQTVVGYNFISTGAPMASVENSTFQFAPAIDGNYSVFLQASFFPVDVSIIQTAVIPIGMQTLLFDAEDLGGGGPLEVLIGTEVVPFSAFGSGPRYTIYSANISAWAGQMEQLTFLTPGNDAGPNDWLIDDIEFSTVPEPSPLALTIVGGVILALRRGFRQR